MSISVYLYFKGQCREAFEHYESVFNAEVICRQSYSEGPPDQFGNEPSDWIMHTTIRIGDVMLQGSDRPASCDEAVTTGNNFAISYRPVDRNSADRVMQALTERGEVTLPMRDTFWGSYFGTCTDRFGVHWIINLPTSNE